MCVGYRNGEQLTRDIPGRKQKRYKITYLNKHWKILRLSPLSFVPIPLLPLRYKMS